MYDAEISSREVVYRLTNPRWVGSMAWRYTREFLARFQTTEFNDLFLRVKPLTMVSYSRLRGLYDATKYVVQNSVAGDIVECGVARGGSAALISLTLEKLRAERSLWLFDTFQGLPKPSERDPDYEIADLYTGTCAATVQEVKMAFQNLEVRADLHFVPGLFSDTLPTAPIRTISLLHIDGDWYESVRTCLDCLYDKVSIGGIIQFDDYGHWAGARRAIDEFIKSRGLEGSLRYLDYSGRQLIKA